MAGSGPYACRRGIQLYSTLAGRMGVASSLRKRFTPRSAGGDEEHEGQPGLLLNNTAGRAEKLRLKSELYKRQGGLWSLCGLPLEGIKERTCEHEIPGLGNKTDAIWAEWYAHQLVGTSPLQLC